MPSPLTVDQTNSSVGALRGELAGIMEFWATASSNEVIRHSMEMAAAKWFGKYFHLRFTVTMHFPPFNYPGRDKYPIYKTGKAADMMTAGAHAVARATKGSASCIVRLPGPEYLNYRPYLGGGKVRLPKPMKFYITILPDREIAYFAKEMREAALTLIRAGRKAKRGKTELPKIAIVGVRSRRRGEMRRARELSVKRIAERK
jgi:hypothetical protein